MATSHNICSYFLEVLTTRKGQPIEQTSMPLERALAAWNGRYEPNSAGALAFELVFQNFLKDFYDKNTLFAYWATWMPRTLVQGDLFQRHSAATTFMLERAIHRSVRSFKRFKVWGGMHRLKLAHPFGRVAIFGKRYIFGDMPASGGNESVNKTAYQPSLKRHDTVYGSNARHISDLSDLDRNFFVLLGGQDGWIGSANFMDQVHLWQKGEYIQVPLRPQSVRSLFTHCTSLVPQVSN